MGPWSAPRAAAAPTSPSVGRSAPGPGWAGSSRARASAWPCGGLPSPLAFDGLSADFAISAAFTDNAASLAVSRKLGYRDDGMKRQVIRGRPAELRRLRLDRAAWLALRDARSGDDEVVIDGLEPCLPMFGLAGR